MSLRPHKYLLLFTVSYLLTVSHCLVRVHVLNVLRRDEILVHYYISRFVFTVFIVHALHTF